jgi:hypothetical protein
MVELGKKRNGFRRGELAKKEFSKSPLVCG